MSLVVARCWICGRASRHKCAGCARIYCSELCQRNDWYELDHKHSCGKPSALFQHVGRPWLEYNHALQERNQEEADRQADTFTRNAREVLSDIHQCLPQIFEELLPLQPSAATAVEQMGTIIRETGVQLEELDASLDRRLQQETTKEDLDVIYQSAWLRQKQLLEHMDIQCDIAAGTLEYVSESTIQELKQHGDPDLTIFVFTLLKRLRRKTVAMDLVDAALAMTNGNERGGPTVEEFQTRISGRNGEGEDDDPKGMKAEKSTALYYGFGSVTRMNWFLDLVFDAAWHYGTNWRDLVAFGKMWLKGENPVRLGYLYVHREYVKKYLADVAMGEQKDYIVDKQKSFKTLVGQWKEKDTNLIIARMNFTGTRSSSREKDLIEFLENETSTAFLRDRRDAALEVFTRMLQEDEELTARMNALSTDTLAFLADILRIMALVGLFGSSFKLLAMVFSPSILLHNWLYSIMDASDLEERLGESRDAVLNLLREHPKAYFTQVWDRIRRVYVLQARTEQTNVDLQMLPEYQTLFEKEGFVKNLAAYLNLDNAKYGEPLWNSTSEPREVVIKDAADMLTGIVLAFRSISLRSALAVSGKYILGNILSVMDSLSFQVMMTTAVLAVPEFYGVSSGWQAGLAPTVKAIGAVLLSFRVPVMEEFAIRRLSLFFPSSQQLELDALTIRPERLSETEYQMMLSHRGIIPFLSTYVRRIVRRVCRGDWFAAYRVDALAAIDMHLAAPNAVSIIHAMALYHRRMEASKRETVKDIAFSNEGLVILYGVATLVLPLFMGLNWLTSSNPPAARVPSDSPPDDLTLFGLLRSISGLSLREGAVYFAIGVLLYRYGFSMLEWTASGALKIYQGATKKSEQNEPTTPRGRSRKGKETPAKSKSKSLVVPEDPEKIRGFFIRNFERLSIAFFMLLVMSQLLGFGIGAYGSLFRARPTLLLRGRVGVNKAKK